MRQRISLILLLFISFSTTHCAKSNATFDTLVWSDEFDDNGPINSEKWFHQTQLPAGGDCMVA